MPETETIAVRRREGTDSDGRTLPYTTPMPPVAGCTVEIVIGPRGGTELVELSRTSETSNVRVLLPITTGLDGECELQIRNEWFRIVGGPESYIDDDPELSGYYLTCTRGGA
jgi:hypothetical protein